MTNSLFFRHQNCEQNLAAFCWLRTVTFIRNIYQGWATKIVRLLCYCTCDFIFGTEQVSALFTFSESTATVNHYNDFNFWFQNKKKFFLIKWKSISKNAETVPFALDNEQFFEFAKLMNASVIFLSSAVGKEGLLWKTKARNCLAEHLLDMLIRWKVVFFSGWRCY